MSAILDGPSSAALFATTYSSQLSLSCRNVFLICNLRCAITQYSYSTRTNSTFRRSSCILYRSLWNDSFTRSIIHRLHIAMTLFADQACARWTNWNRGRCKNYIELYPYENLLPRRVARIGNESTKIIHRVDWIMKLPSGASIRPA
jgi:hypothetical protein